MSLTSRPVYTSNQIAAGAFFGGPIASTLMMRRNFLAFGEQKHANKTLIYGLLSTVLLLVLAFILPKQIPNTALPIGYMISFRSVAKHFQMDKSNLRARGLLIGSNWRVVCISSLWLLVMAVVIFAVVFVFAAVGQQAAHYQH